jgi:hypothetical protein
MVHIVFVFCFLWNGGDETGARDHYRDSVSSTRFAITCKTAKTAKLRGIREIPPVVSDLILKILDGLDYRAIPHFPDQLDASKFPGLQAEFKHDHKWEIKE